ncbi:hypothetical protein ACFV9D_28755 [Streptomyces sp. NPDC059875]|uniref:hypothetical protein n=1 Tax=unclassified Streptomyces TaxID=2593676 RepID=UPI003663A39D
MLQAAVIPTTDRPLNTPHGRIAVLRDNQGARFAVLAGPSAEPVAESTAERADEARAVPGDESVEPAEKTSAPSDDMR